MALPVSFLSTWVATDVDLERFGVGVDGDARVGVVVAAVGAAAAAGGHARPRGGGG